MAPPEAFIRLMREGIGVGDRKMNWMAEEAQKHLHVLSDAEIAAMHAYLRALPQLRG